ncbi:hypothetical protein TraAM80_03495 [Trypanosoma rangeli]|uniref:U3 small nucleolar RNA-associated protein 6 N-terminal domain-containing protein n=1 Tax=Trypanosoma rangeli TaxID=5698 RepID=A0A422NNV4_TRYRA|nr:uncharacterized protein TraAM80_03495 [Trypanosoma rangeli]RNF07141.1 hypothetical protein TraAM80_03495 [Trypanosoma rangeli]|eukprot:RNF07141.1 hypothetical protein TraAM80_03495 [Trypanosoma rangeli]
MARARAIDTRLEKLLPSLEEYFTSGFLTREETQEVARQRAHWEYRLVAKPLLLLDVQNAVVYELGLERRIQEYCRTTKLVLRHRWAVLERIETIYRIGIKHIKDREESELLRNEFVQFLKAHNRHSSLSALYGELMVRYPTRSSLWVEAALYEGIEMGNTDNGRAIVQQAILTAGTQPEVWDAALLLELHFADRLLRGLVEEGANKAPHASEHDIVEELRAENAALANVVVDLALVRAVVGEALESPACGPRLVRLLLESAMRFSFTKSVVQELMASAASKMISTLTSGDASTGNASHHWSEAGLSRFVLDFLSIDVLMLDHGVTGDAALFLRSGGRLRASTPAERTAALVKAFTAALTLAQTEGMSSFLILGRLRETAIAELKPLLEALQKLTSLSGVSTVCRRLISEQHLAVEEAVQCLGGPTDAAMLQRLANGAAERVQAVLQGLQEAPASVKKVKHEETSTRKRMWRLLPFLLPADRKAVGTAVPRSTTRCATEDDVEQLVFSQGDGKDDAALEHALTLFLREFHLIGHDEGIEGIHQLRFVMATTPIVLWKVFHLLELRCKPKGASARGPSSVSRDSDSDSDSDNDGDGVGQRNQGRTTVDDTSYASAGLKFLASVPQGLLDPRAEEERLEGCWGLMSARVQTLTGMRGSTTRADFIGCLQRSSSDAWVESLRSLLRVACLCEPIPRRAHVEIAIPFLEAVALERGGKDSNAVQEARGAHERLLGMYALSKHPSSFPPLVQQLPRREGTSCRLAPAEMNAVDWARLVVFERDVAKDLRRAKEAAARARRLSLAPQRLLSLLNAY